MSGALPEQVRLVEVGPRDGLQNEPGQYQSADFKVALIEKLADAGLSHIECGSFVSAVRVPQMADSLEVLQALQRKPGVRYTALTPNVRAIETALAARVDEVAVFTAVSDEFNRKNINCTTAESLQRFQPAIALARQHQLPVRAYISTVMGCPYSGPVTPGAVTDLSEQLLQMGCYEISLGDTIGIGTPKQTTELINSLLSRLPAHQLAVHFHDTYGQALANIYVALQAGISTIDCSVAGLGGCPYARGASGNVATEDVLYMLNGLGINTGVDLPRLVATSQWACRQLKRKNGSKVSRALEPSAGDEL